MTREEKIKRITTLADEEGTIFLKKPVMVDNEPCDIIDVDSIMRDIDGDWCIIASFDKDMSTPRFKVPFITDEELDRLYDAVFDHAKDILKMGK